MNADGTSDAFDIIPWFNFTTFDAMSLCRRDNRLLQTSNYPPLITLIFQSIRGTRWSWAYGFSLL